MGSETTLYLVLKATGTNLDGTESVSKTFTIPNPIEQSEFDADDAKSFLVEYGTVYGLRVTLKQAYYETRTKTYVFPTA